MESLDAALVFTALALLIYGIYKKLTQYHDFWAKQNVPFIKPHPIVGSAGLFSVSGPIKPLHHLEQEWYENYGKIYGRFEGPNPVLSIGDPEILRDVLCKDAHYFPNRRDMKFHDPIMDNTLFILEGEAWKRVRSVVSPTFTTAKLKRMMPLLSESCDFLIEKLSHYAKTSEVVHCQKHFEQFVLHAIGRCAFGMSMNSLKDPDSPFIEKSKKLFQECLSWRTILTILCPKLMKIFRIKLLNPETTEFYKNIIIDVLEQRKKHHVIKDDFLQILLDAENSSEDSNNNGDTVCSSNVCSDAPTVQPTKKPVHKGLSHDEMLSQCITFFIAGFEPTTSLLSNVVYNLATHPDCQNQVVAEMKEQLEASNNDMHTALQKMKFTSAVLDECLRMCPAMVRSERRLQDNYYIQKKNIVLKKGMLISIPVYAMHHDPNLYKDPEQFNPDRFHYKNKDEEKQMEYIHLPFGRGKRMCVGNRFVLLQVKLCLVKLLTKFEILPAPTTPASLEYVESRNILSVGKVEVLLRERLSS